MRTSKKYIRAINLLILISLLTISCKDQNTSAKVNTADKEKKEISVDFRIPDWAAKANIYEVNIRQFTPEGTFKSFTNHIPRLKEMQVDILWLMPIFPISETKRKGTLGSYYAVSDFAKVNPEFGTLADFKTLVSTAHFHGMKVILDWVPNHTGWDHVWLKNHPEYYTQDSDGNPIDPIDPNTGKSWGWTDVADLNYNNQEMRAEMIKDMLYWVNEEDTDGFRFDVAHGVPLDFWLDTKSKLLAADNQQFLLAEAELEDQMNAEAFHMAYGWEFHHVINDIAKGEKNVRAIDEWLKKDKETFKKGFKMHFTSNHDENSWAGTVFERMKDSHKAFAVLTSTFDGMPLIYGGQEEPLDRRLEFFEKDDIGFKDYKYADFYTSLNKLKHDNSSLWNKPYGAPLVKITDHDHIYGFTRTAKNGDKVTVLINLSDKPQLTKLNRDLSGTDIFSGKESVLKEATEVALKPWEYIVLSKIIK